MMERTQAPVADNACRTQWERSAPEAATAVGALVAHQRLVVGSPWTLAIEELTRIVTPTLHVVTVRFEVSGGVDGIFVVLLDAPTALRIHKLLLPRRPLPPSVGALPPEVLATLGEVGNIAVSACLNAFARELGGACLPSVPSLREGVADLLVREAFQGAGPISATAVDIDAMRVWLCMADRDR
jgi:hypothetical protein